MRALARELIETVILALIIFLALDFSVQNFRVEGPSMEPTLHDGQHLLVNNLVYLQLDSGKLRDIIPFIGSSPEDDPFPFSPPHRGDVIVFRFPDDESRDFIKRVIGIPGDIVEIKRGQLYIDGVARSEPYVTNRDTTSMAATKVPQDSYFVLGDNRPASSDSRRWKTRFVPADNVIGRALVTYWPIGNLSAVGHPGWP